jgi:hypothetical protein
MVNNKQHVRFDHERLKYLLSVVKCLSQNLKEKDPQDLLTTELGKVHLLRRGGG